MAWDSSIASALRGRRTLVTGHTGFKGAWLCLWLEELGADVAGLSLPAQEGTLYARAGMASRWSENFVDIRTFSAVNEALRDFQPELVFHLAAQPLVSVGYQQPVLTFETNVVGTMNVLEAIRLAPEVRGAVVVTTDKVYRPTSLPHRHGENDPLGGEDPYSASKSAAEHVITAWRTLVARTTGASIIAARAGNVIGGGDFADNRLLPDLVRAFSEGRVAQVRHPDFTRPWQHVLDPLAGYLSLGARIVREQSFPSAVNFGPDVEEAVYRVADIAAQLWGDGASWTATRPDDMPETRLLALSSDLAERELGWTPNWTTEQAVGRTVTWWKALQAGADPIELCLRDIADYMSGDPTT